MTLDVQNSFNSANWNYILVALRLMVIPEHIRCLIASYFRDRVFIYDTEEGSKTSYIKEGVPQGLVLGPLPWNIMFDMMTKLSMRVETKTINFVNDVAGVIGAKYLQEVTQLAN